MITLLAQGDASACVGWSRVPGSFGKVRVKRPVVKRDASGRRIVPADVDGTFFNIRLRTLTMRTVRWLTSGFALVSLLPAVSAAQSSSTRVFEDSWFWGAKAGLVSFSTSGGGSKAAPSFGAEWLITRSRGALYLSGEQAIFKTRATVRDENGTPYTANISNLRRYTAALLAFPTAWGALRPYGGAGLSMNLVRSPSGPTVPEAFDDRRSSTSFLLMAGTQAQYRRISIFGQATFMPARNSLFNRPVYIFESGLRYNFSASKE
jgi:hypothetical protein